MIPWERLGEAAIPGGATLRLMRRGAEYSIMLGTNELMNSRLSGSEESLATLACERIRDRPAPEILIGGLGMGFTLRAALAQLAPTAKVVVAELVPEVIDWARGPLSPVFAGSLDDPRVTVEAIDVVDRIGADSGRYDAILLDVDNGPEGIVSAGNDRLYGVGGLETSARALRPGGVLTIWSATPDSRFGWRLGKAGFAVEEVKVRAGRSKRGARHIIWVATRPA